jgi:23S rRNA pseudouridine1911/1915/1917 synthase
VKRVLTRAVGDPPGLRAFLVERLQIDDAAVAAMIERGAVEVAGRRMKQDVELALGARVVAFLPEAAKHTEEVRVAYRDEHVLVLDKPAGLRSQGVRGDGSDTLWAHAQALSPDASLLHRLDRDTSGLVLFPLTDRARDQLQRALTDGKIDRHYTARVSGPIVEQRITLRIARDPHDPRRRVTRAANDTAGEDATTLVTPQGRIVDDTLVHLTLLTGRTHQLRVHLAAVGHPILGDTLYGGAPAPRLCLHAHLLRFVHPRSGTPKEVSSAIPPLFAQGDLRRP